MSLKKDIRDASSVLDQSVADFEGLQKDIVELSGTLQLYRIMMSEGNEYDANAAAIIQGNSAELSDIKDQINDLRAQCEPYKQQMRAADLEIGSRLTPLQEQEKSTKTDEGSLERELTYATKDLEDCLSERRSLEQKVESIIEKLARVKNPLTDASDYGDAENRRGIIADYEMELEQVRSSIDSLDSRIEQMRFDISQVNNRLSQTRSSLGSIQSELAPVEAEYQRATSPIRKMLEPLEGEISRLRHRSEALQAENAAIQKNLGVLQQVSADPSIVQSAETALASKWEELNAAREAILQQKNDIGRLEDRRADAKTIVLVVVVSLVVSIFVGPPVLQMVLGA